MTIFECRKCKPDKPCLFDNGEEGEEWEDEVKPDRCPIEDYEHAKWEIQKEE